MALEMEIAIAEDAAGLAVAKDRSGCHDCTNPDCKRRLLAVLEAVGAETDTDQPVREH